MPKDTLFWIEDLCNADLATISAYYQRARHITRISDCIECYEYHFGKEGEN